MIKNAQHTCILARIPRLGKLAASLFPSSRAYSRVTLTVGRIQRAWIHVCAIRNLEESITTKLLGIFYKNLASGQSASDALYLAKKEIKKSNSNPKVWQSFIYTGANQNFISEKAGIKDWYPIFFALFFAVCVWLLIKVNFN